MTCSFCASESAKNVVMKTPNPQSTPNPFVNGCYNMRLSAVTDHEKSATHQKSSTLHAKKSISGPQILRTDAVRALNSLIKADRDRLFNLFRNTHAVISNNRPLRDYVWLSKLDAAKCLSIGQTYINEKAALKFSNCIAEVERSNLRKEIKNTKFLVFLMDGSTDISGDEQEVIYLRYSITGKVKEKFLAIGSPKSTKFQVKENKKLTKIPVHPRTSLRWTSSNIQDNRIKSLRGRKSGDQNKAANRLLYSTGTQT